MVLDYIIEILFFADFFLASYVRVERWGQCTVDTTAQRQTATEELSQAE